VQAGQQLLERWAMRNEAIAQLEAVMDEVSGPVTSQSSPSRDQEGRLYLCVPCMFLLTSLHLLHAHTASEMQNSFFLYPSHCFSRSIKLRLAQAQWSAGLPVQCVSMAMHTCPSHLIVQYSMPIPFLIAGPTVADHEAFWAEWALRIQTLERGIEQARQQGISVSRAKRVLKELQAQANAAEAAAKLEALLLRKPCKASLLKVSPLKSHVVLWVTDQMMKSDIVEMLIHRKSVGGPVTVYSGKHCGSWSATQWQLHTA
jgi:hypothetical protein